MSSTDETLPASADARRVETEAAGWLQRQTFWKWTEEDQTEFDAWLNKATSHRIAYVRVCEAWKRTHRLTMLRSPLTRPAQPQASRRFLSLFGAAAATVAICAIGSGTYLYTAAPRERIIATAVGEHRLVTLPDGSTIELNTDTVIRVSQAHGARSINLDRGEAYFEVRHDDAHPFTVTIGDRQLTDLGTKFLIHADQYRLDVSVFEGRVLFDAQQNRNRKVALLTTGDELVATANSFTRLKRSVSDLSIRLGWRRGVLIFKNTPLVDAVSEFNRYHESKLVIPDAKVGRLMIGGTFATDNVAAFTEVAQDVLGLRVVARGNETALIRR